MARRTWARCANCGKATYWCARRGCNPKPAKKPEQEYRGMSATREGSIALPCGDSCGAKAGEACAPDCSIYRRIG